MADESMMSAANTDGVTQAQRLLGEARGLAERGDLNDALDRLATAHELDVDAAEVMVELARLHEQLRLLQKLQRNTIVGRTKRVSSSPDEAIAAFRQVLQDAQDTDSGLAQEIRAQLAELSALEARLHEPDVRAKADELVAALGEAGTDNWILAYYMLPSVRAWFALAIDQARVRHGFGMLQLGDCFSAYSIAKDIMWDTSGAGPDADRVVELAVEARRELQSTTLKSAQEILDRARALKNRGELESALSLLQNWEVPRLHQILHDHPEVLSHFDPFDALIQHRRQLRLEILAELAPRLCSVLTKAVVADDVASGSLLDACVDDAKLIVEHLLDLRYSRETS